jgi:hypothetical protein
MANEKYVFSERDLKTIENHLTPDQCRALSVGILHEHTVAHAIGCDLCLAKLPPLPRDLSPWLMDLGRADLLEM